MLRFDFDLEWIRQILKQFCKKKNSDFELLIKDWALVGFGLKILNDI